jgi:hypothetical protein
MWHILFLSCLFLLGTPAFSFAADGLTVFPPENESECNADTALAWNGSGNVRCEKVIKVNPQLGDPIFIRQSAAYTDWVAYNAYLSKAIEDKYKDSYNGNAALQQQAISEMKANCLVKNGGQISPTSQSDAIPMNIAAGLYVGQKRVA